MDSGVYLIRNTVNQKVYVGSSKDIPHRWKEHRAELVAGKHDNPKLLNAFRKYGGEVFKIEVFCSCLPDKLLEEEQKAIEELKAVEEGYNIATKADRPPSPKGKLVTESHRKHLSEAKMGLKATPEHTEALRQGWVKRRARGLGTHSEETRKRRSLSLRGKKKPESFVVFMKNRQQGTNELAALRDFSSRRTPEYISWQGRKGMAKQLGRQFNEPRPEQCFYEKTLPTPLIEYAALAA